MKKLTVERANELKAAGITHIASIVKQCYNTKYFVVTNIDRILANGGVRPKTGYYFNGESTFACEWGDTEKNIDWKKTIRWKQI